MFDALRLPGEHPLSLWYIIFIGRKLKNGTVRAFEERVLFPLYKLQIFSQLSTPCRWSSFGVVYLAVLNVLYCVQ